LPIAFPFLFCAALERLAEHDEEEFLSWSEESQTTGILQVANIQIERERESRDRITEILTTIDALSYLFVLISLSFWSFLHTSFVICAFYSGGRTDCVCERVNGDGTKQGDVGGAA